MSDLRSFKHADIVITGVGKAGFMTPEMFKEGRYGSLILVTERSKENIPAISIRALSANRQKSPIVWYTPTPGGTGPLLVAKLFENFYELNKE